MATKTLVCLVVMVALSSAVPLIRDDLEEEYQSTQCAKKCTPKGNPKFDYKSSQTYVYEYKAEAETEMAGASEDKARMLIETLANIEVIDSCEFALRLQDVNVLHSGPYTSLKQAERSQEFQTTLMANTLRFSFDDGIIRDVCPSSEEKIWVLNFKRGLLSAFQNSMVGKKTQRVTEIDVSGECEADYEFSTGWRSKSVQKSKNLTACYHHSGMKTFIPMVPYKVSSEIQSLPVMKSTHECEQVISSSDILQSSTCSENHVFAPLSNHQSGGATKVKQSLIYKAVKTGIETGYDIIESRTNLMFKHVNGIDEILNSREVAEQKLKEICEQTKTDIRPETARLFTELVQIVKVLDSNDLRNVYRMIKNKRLCSENDISMKFLLDTLPVAGTPGAVELMVTVINGNDVPDLEKDAWLTSLSLIPEPSEDMLPSLVKLMSGKSARKSLLPVSALLNTMCSKNVDCERSYQFRKIVKKIKDNIDSSCTSQDQAQLMETLRAIGNIGYGDDFLDTLKTCLASSYATLEVKVAAADAYRRFACLEDEEAGPLFQVFENQNDEPELRIMSFLSLMRCPRDAMLRKIAAQLDKETDENVGTFVYTHLENLKKTSDPHKQDIARAVEHLTLKKFDDAGFKTSRCFESSVLLNRLNLGYVADGDVIWSQSSMVPRAMKLNLTVELFGNSVNLFEAGARVDGLEKFIQKYFGMEGYLTPHEASPEDLQAFIYGRMFGNELFFKHIKGSEEYEKVKSYLNFDKILENLSKDFNIAYSHSQQLMDHSLIIPTIIGLPVNLTVNSSVTVDTRANGKVDLAGILSRSKPIVLTTDLAASAALEVTGSMMVDAQLYKQGLRMRNTLHSSVSLKSDLSIKGRQVVNFQIDTPQEKQELFDARSQFFIIHDNFEKEQEMIKENRQEYDSCTGDKFAQVTGLELCGKLQYPNATLEEDAPYFPITGPVRASLVLNKKDTHRNYKIFAKWVRNSRKLEAQLQLDTPGSQVDRHISADVTIGTHRNPHVDAVLVSPWKKIIFNGKAGKNNDIASLTGSLSVDEDLQLKLTSELKMSSKGRTSEYLPFVEIEKNDERITLLSGSVTHNQRRDITSKLELKDLFKQSYTVAGKLVFSGQEKRIEMSALKEGGKPYIFKAGSTFKMSGRKNQNGIKVEPELFISYPKGRIVSLTSNADMQYKPLKVIGNMEINAMRMRKPIKLKVNIRPQKRQIYKVITKLETPILTGNVNGKVTLNKNKYGGDMKITYNTKSFSDVISWDGKLQDRSRNKYIHYNIKSNLAFKKNSDYNTMTSLEVTRKTSGNRVENSTLDVTINYGKKTRGDKTKVIQLSTSLNADWKKAQVKADLNTKVPELDFALNVGVNHLHSAQKFDSQVKLSVASKLENDVIADIHFQNKGSNLMVITADGNLEAGGEKLTVKTGLNQKSHKRFEHSLTVTVGDGDEHSLFTVYRNAKDGHHITTNIESAQLDKPLSIELSSNIDNPSNFHVSGSLKDSDKDIYSIDALSKLEGNVAGKLNVQITHPSRQMMARANFNNVNNRITSRATLNWDVGSKDRQTPEVDMTGMFTRISKDDLTLLKGNVKVNTPFKNLEKLNTNWNFEKTEGELKSMGKLAWGGIHKQLSGSLNAKLPISTESAKVHFQAKTPFKNYKDVELEVDHTLNSGIKSTLRGKLEKDEAKLILDGKANIKDYSQKIEGDLTLKTPFRGARQIVLTLDHSVDEKGIASDWEINHDGQKYGANYKFWLAHSSTRNGQLKLYGPERSSITVLTHKIVGKTHMIDGSIDSSLKRNKRRYNVDISGHYLNLNDLKLNIDIKSPLKSLRKGGVEIGLQLEEGSLESKIIFSQNRGKTGYDFKLTDNNKAITTDLLLLLSPMYENDVTWKATVQYGNFPLTVNSEINLAPYRTIAVQGSYKAESIDDIDVDFKLVTSLEGLKNIDFVASNTIQNSVRVSHLNIGYDLRKTLDIEIRSRNDDDKKLLRLNVNAPILPFESLDTGVSLDTSRGSFSRADLELVLSRDEKYEGQVSMKLFKNGNIQGKLDVKTPEEGYKHLEGSITSENRKYTSAQSLSLTLDDVKLIDFSVDIQQNSRFIMTTNVITEGTVFEYLAREYSDLLKERDVDDWVFNVLRNYREDAKKLTTNIVMEESRDQIQWTISLMPEFKTGPRPTIIKIKQSGDSWTDFGIDGSMEIRNERLIGKLVVKVDDPKDIKYESMLTFPQGEQAGVHFSLSGDLDQLEVKGGVKFLIESEFEFMINSIQKIELISTTKGWRNRESFVKIKYTHEGQDNRASCSFSVEDEDGIRGSIDLVAQKSPIHLFSLEVKSPFQKVGKTIISGDYDETKMNCLIKYADEEKFFLSGDHSNFKNPKLTLKTPFSQLQALTFDVNGDLRDGNIVFTWNFNDNDQIDGNVAGKYDSVSQMDITSTFNAKYGQKQNKLVFEYENTVAPRKTSKLLLSLNDLDKISFTTEIGEMINGDRKLDLDFTLMYPSLGIESQGAILKLEGNTEKATGSIEMLDGSGKTIDADVYLDLASEKKATISFRKPSIMEYSFTGGRSQDENEIYLNWDKTDPAASLVITATYKDDSNLYTLDKFVSIKLSCPSRSIGFEHSIAASTRSIDSSGKLFWNNGFDSEVSYDLTLKDRSNRRLNSYDGELKFKLPTRTIGIAGSASDGSDKLQGETSFSWDMDNDSTKKVGLKGTILKEAHTQADFSLILPRDAHVDSKLVMNKGNTILEGQTQIFYSDQSRKTLTLFSKLENNPGSSYFYSNDNKYNYSLELGMSHPDTRIDVKMVSHLGVDSDRLTTAVGLDYLTSRRQNKNMDLFMEINKLKKEFNLVSNTPYKSISMSGAVVSEDPINYRGSINVDDEVRYAANLIVNPTSKRADLDWTTYGTTFTYSAFFPNMTALQIQRKQLGYDTIKRDVKVLFHLASPDVLQTTLNWRKGLVVEARDRFFGDLESFWRELKELVDDAGVNLKREVQEKYSDVASSIFEDAILIVNSAEEELGMFEAELLALEVTLQQTCKFCTLQLENHLPLGTLFKENVQYRPLFQGIRTSLRELSDALKELQNVPAEKVIEEFNRLVSSYEKGWFDSEFWRIAVKLHKVEMEKFDNFWNKVDESVQKYLDPQRGINNINKAMERLRTVKLSTVILNTLKEYGSLTDSKILEQLFGLDEDIPKWKNDLLKVLIQVIDAEAHDLLESVRILRNPITRFDPELGILQVELPLPVTLERLDKVPTLDDLYNKVLYYIPDNIYQSNNSGSVQEVIVDEGLEGFDEYQPNPRYRFRQWK